MAPLTEEKCSTKTPGHCHQLLYWCSDCESVLCENCWGLQAVHESGTGSGTRVKRKKHEKTELAVADYVLSVLEPNLTEEALAESHVTNVQTRWFGVEIDDHSEQVSLKSKAFLELASGSGKDPSSQYPCLVSFIGETGAGKSTLINAMMKSVGATQIGKTTPVIGTKIDSPTSGDVHLFPDPKTLSTPRPVFFADCEGFGGGNCAPLAERQKESNRRFKLSYHHYRTRLRKRSIHTCEKYTRQWAVDELYPRILFTFSDVVCLVSKNFRMIENHIVNLLTWADNVFERSLNQPMLPKAIIVVNAVDGMKNTEDIWWDVDKVTGEQLEKHQHRINLYREPPTPRSTPHTTDGTAPHTSSSHDNVAILAHRWRTERKKTINSLKDLILCYYSDFKIICIPSANDPPHTINKQYAELGELIAAGAQDSQKARKKAGLLMTGEELDYYLEQGFDHFSKSKEPFNFFQAAVRGKPVSIGFSDHLLRTAFTLLRQWPYDRGRDLLENLAPIVASSIFLDVIRNRTPHDGNPALIFNIYRSHCQTAQEEMYRKYWRCEEKSQRGERCINHLNGHTKGHQDHKGRVFKAGEFWAADELDSMDQIKLHSEKIEVHLKEMFDNWNKNLPGIVSFEEQKRVALKHHLERTSILHDSRMADVSPKLTSHTTCFCCLISIPLYPLFCGHVICQECLECLAKKELDYFELNGCPLHNCDEWPHPWRTNFSPPTAGLRILALDGGGVRSIVQLTILQELEKFIGLGINIVDFFDLIIGTSGGGIVATGLGIRKFTTQQCIEKFHQVSKQAFAQRTGANNAILRPLVEARHNSRYKTTNMVEALQRVFGEQTILFGGKRDSQAQPLTRVGVTTTTSTGRPFLLANYQRPEPTLQDGYSTAYCFYRGETPEEELKVWEALRATSAAPKYFKSFYHPASGHTFDDGGITYNNPVGLANIERKIIWPEQKERDPDILLSIGTLWSDEVKPDSKPEHRVSAGARLGLSRLTKRLLSIAVNTVKDTVDCEKAWSRFYASLNIGEEDGYRKKKYCRINPKTPNIPPSLDSVSSMDELQTIAQRYCFTSREFRNAASTLMASLFYFELESAEEYPQPGLWTCEGNILCRLPANSSSLKKLCNRLLKQHGTNDARQSWFYIKSVQDEYQQLFKVGGSALEASKEVSEGGGFCLPVTFKKWQWDTSCRIYVTLDGPKNEGFIISGFPRDPLQDKTWSLYRNFLPDKEEDKGDDSERRSNSMESARTLYYPLETEEDDSLVDLDMEKVLGNDIDEEFTSASVY